jgi:hypothetical protein
MFQPPPETLIGQITAAFAIGLQTGPVRLDFTDRRFIVTSNTPPSLPPALGQFRSWKATLPLPPYCRTSEVPYLQDLAQVWAEIPNEEVSEIRAHREVGLGVDKTMSQLTVTNIRRGLGPWGGHGPGVSPRSWGSIELLFRVPAPPEQLHAFLLQTPLAGVVRPE